MNEITVIDPVPAVVEPTPIIPRDLIKLIAMDIGKDVCAYIEVMYPEAVKATSSTFLLSVRNSIHNQIMASLETTNEADILARLEKRKIWRRKWKAHYKKIRENRNKP